MREFQTMAISQRDAGGSSKERRFFEVLRNLFIGVPIEGESGYINLMRIKARYFERVIAPHLQREVAKELQPFPDFREELFEKLYAFFRRYFTESGSIGFFFTPYHQSVYEQVYTNEQDVVLFWKTARLYYVKTDRLFRSMTVEVDGFRFHFDVSQLEHKRANEKRELIYAFKERRQDGVIVFTVRYSEKGRQTKIDDIRRAIRNALGLNRYTDAVPSEETIQKALRIFERQSEVDYFICKDAKRFLREQFDLWMWQYLLGKPGEEPQTEWTEIRLKQLQALKRIAYRVIDFIAAFEDELVKIWNKPKFVLDSHYVITLDRVAKQPGGMAVLERLLAHPKMEAQIQEWRELGMVDENFQPKDVWQGKADKKDLHPRYRYLPIDTKHFPDLEIAIVALFDNLDEALDGWLIKSENYQALRTILPKWRGKVKAIYIDPPYNTGVDEFLYVDNFKHSSWLTMMENRLSLAKQLLSEDGVIFISIGDLNPQEGESYRLQMLASAIFPKRFGNLIWKKRGGIGSFSERDMTENHEYVLVYGNERAFLYHNILSEQKLKEFSEVDERGPYRWMGLLGPSQQTKEKRPNLNYEVLIHPKTFQLVGFRYVVDGAVVTDLRADTTDENLAETAISIAPPGKATWLISKEQMWKHAQSGLIQVRRTPKGNYELRIKNYLYDAEGNLKGNLLKSLLTDNGVPVGTNADASRELSALCSEADVEQIKPKPVSLIRLLLQVSSASGDLVMDFFAGSGTTAHAVMNLCREGSGRRKYILVEVGEHFYTILIPRIKKVIFSDRWRDGKAQPDSKGVSHFVKYYELEQFEDTLRRAHYEDGNFFVPPEGEDPCQYIFLGDLKMLGALEVDLERDEVRVDLGKLYENIDLPETLSNLTGKRIRRVQPDPEDPTKPASVEFEDGEKVNLKRLDWRLVKGLIWW
jgi:adenine-specific DNA-methyltransferase